MFKKYLPFITALAFVAISVAAVEYAALQKTMGHFCYPLDDTFIHMAVAKNLALHGNWGITSSGFVSTSSSPLFTVVLALAFKLFSIHITIPFIISCIGTILMLWAMQQELDKHSSLSVGNKIICMLAAVLAGTVPALTLLGMEHTLQIAFTLFFAHKTASLLRNTSRKNLVAAMLWAALMTATRYENASFLLAAFALLAWQRKFVAAILVPAAGFAPVILFGVYAKMHGGYFAPNSVLIKGNQNFQYFANGGQAVLQATASISAIVFTCMIICYNRFRLKKFDRDFWILSMLLVAGLMHSVFASFGWFYRYEAYLIVLGIFHLSKLALQWLQVNGVAGIKRQLIPIAFLAVIFYSLPVRGMNAYRNSVRAIYNIYEQQYQMGLFFKEYYKGETVAANDVGAISFMADLHTIDMWGLGNNQVAAARKGHYWTNEFLQKLVADNHTRVAVMYDSWFDKDLTKPWIKVATWQLPYNYICGDIKVTFYGMNAAEADTLKQHLDVFNAKLPGDVRTEYFH